MSPHIRWFVVVAQCAKTGKKLLTETHSGQKDAEEKDITASMPPKYLGTGNISTLLTRKEEIFLKIQEEKVRQVPPLVVKLEELEGCLSPDRLEIRS